MDLNEFEEKFLIEETKIGLDISKQNITKLYNYMKILLKWNKNINLTAIVEENEIIKKHLIDSLTISNFIKDNSKIIDVGTGAGFPGVPIAITRNVNITLLDSLNKRICFLEEVKNQLDLNNIKTIHGRAEEIARKKEYREQFDVATSRAVAPMNVLLEYLLPFVKVGGICICMKGPKATEEILKINNVLKLLGARYVKTINLNFDKDMERNLIIIEKIKEINSRFPRKPGTPTKQPLQ